MKSLSVTIQMKATEQYFPVLLFIMLYKMVLTFESVDDILKLLSKISLHLKTNSFRFGRGKYVVNNTKKRSASIS